MKLKELRERNSVTQKELVGSCRFAGLKYIDGPLISKFEKGYALPNKDTLKYLCTRFGVEVADIYEKKEIDLKNANGKILTKRSQKGKNFCVMLDRQAYSWLKPSVFAKAGYESARDWLEAKLAELKKELEQKALTEQVTVKGILDDYVASLMGGLKNA
jgi:transcriptional regulator with XRE-family HTH domain